VNNLLPSVRKYILLDSVQGVKKGSSIQSTGTPKSNNPVDRIDGGFPIEMASSIESTAVF